jgi:hypothetical protein
MGTNHAQDISNELQNNIPVTLTEPVHTPEVLTRHAIQEQMVALHWTREHTTGLLIKKSNSGSGSCTWSTL